MPETANRDAIEARLRRVNPGLNVYFKEFGDDVVEAEQEAIRVAEADSLLYISPYDDLEVVGGQGTIAVEMLDQIKAYGLEKLDAIFVPVGGGGLISGIASYVKSVSPNTKIIGCQPRNNACLMNSVLKGYVLPLGRYERNGGGTISDGTAGGIVRGTFTYNLCKAKACVDQWVEVSEMEIEEAIVGFH